MNGAGIPVLFGIAAALASVLALREAASASPAVRGWVQLALEPLRRARGEGYLPTSRERLRLSLLLGLVAIALGWYLAGLTVALLLLAVSPFVAGYLITRSRKRYRSKVEAAMPDASRAIADGLTAGHSPRGALAAATVSLEGPAAVEFHRIAMDLEAGTPTTRAVEMLAERFRSARVDAFCTAMVSQSLAGGDLAALMRRFAEGAAERDRIVRDARSATAQARFTGYLVVSMPVGAALFTELLRPGFLVSLTGSVPALVLLSMAAGLQLLGFLVISRLAKTGGPG